MKIPLIPCILWVAAALVTPLHAESKTYSCKFEQDIPIGVSAWSQSERVRKGIGKENRFGPYEKGNAAELANDALLERGGEAQEKSEPRETAFWQAYDEKGWYLYIESKEPLVKDLLNQLIDSRSQGHKESYELFFAPGLKEVPYYQVYINPYRDKATYYDWAMPNPDYRSLKNGARVESLPLETGVGTFVFIPWELLYERAPLDGGEWRFTLIRWMPFSKSGGVTWGGRVHETGQFGIVRFEKPAPAQREALQRRLLQYAWFKFQALSDQLREFWSDPFIGDPQFYEKSLAPEIARLTAAGEQWAGDPAKLTPGQIKEAMPRLKDWMEFDYKTADLRRDYLRQLRFAGR